MKKFLLTASAALMLALGLAAPASAASTYSVGVKSINVSPTTDHCEPGQALPCTLDAGTGDANVLRITQHETADGEMRFSQFVTTADNPDDLWMAARIGAECRTGHHLTYAAFRPEYRNDAFNDNTPVEVSLAWEGAGVDVPRAKKMPTKTVALDIPVEGAFADVDGFELSGLSLADIYESGEEHVDELVASGMSEAEARATPYNLNTWLELHADVRCGTANENFIYVKRVPVALPLEIQYVPAPMPAPAAPPARGQAHGNGLTLAAGVTHASLNVIPDPAAPCTLHLSGSITSAVDTEVEYRFIDEHGQRSNGFRIDVTADQAAFFSHEVTIGDNGTDDGPGFTVLDQPRGIGGYAVADNGNETGTYQLEVSSPNLFLSNVDGYNIPACS